MVYSYLFFALVLFPPKKRGVNRNGSSFAMKRSSLLMHKVHKMNSLVLVSVEPSDFISDCSVMQNTSQGTVCVAAFKPGQVYASGDLCLLCE